MSPVLSPTQSRKSNDGRDDGKRVDTGQPFLIKHYNKTMGGVDRTDRNVNRYRTAIFSKKYSWPIFAFISWIVVFSKPNHRLTQEAQNRTNDRLAICHTIERAFLVRGPRLLSPRRAASQYMVLEQIHSDRLDQHQRHAFYL